MTTRAEYFGVGRMAARIELVAQMSCEEPGLGEVRERVREILTNLGALKKGEDLPTGSGLTQHVADILSDEDRASFELGADFATLQEVLRVGIAASRHQGDQPPPPQDARDAAKPIVRRLRVWAAQVHAPEEVGAFLQRVGRILADQKEWLSASAELFEESDFIVALSQSILEAEDLYLSNVVKIRPSSNKIDLLRQSEPSAAPQRNKVFVVHGHNEGIKETLARFLERIGLQPVILHEQPNEGRTVIEKFSAYAEVQFAVVLLTGDDIGKSCKSDLEAHLRARQNVILELGYFLGSLGRDRVCALYESGVELPSDYSGVLYISLDPSHSWKVDLVRELKAAGLAVNADRAF